VLVEAIVNVVVSLFFLVFSFLFIFAIFRVVKGYGSLLQLRAKNVDWYRSAHPTAIKDNQLICVGCGSSRRHAQPLTQMPMVREHFCADCGKSLFYSEETKLV
jgi:hypothetical protein